MEDEEDLKKMINVLNSSKQVIIIYIIFFLTKLLFSFQQTAEHVQFDDSIDSAGETSYDNTVVRKFILNQKRFLYVDFRSTVRLYKKLMKF